MEGFQTKVCAKCKVEYHLACFYFYPSNMQYGSYCLHCIDNKNRSRKPSRRSTKESSETKFCTGCSEIKSLTEYYFNTQFNTYHKVCKVCRKKAAKEQKLQLRYGVDAKWLKDTLMLQDNKCAICKIPFNDTDFKPFVDHNAANGKVRGILCNPCNVLLGLHHESCETLRASGHDRYVEYLEYFKRIHEIKLVG